MAVSKIRHIRMSDTEWAEVKDAALVRGVSASELIRTALKELLAKEDEK